MESNSGELFSIKGIAAYTGLTPAYIGKCIEKLSLFLDPHCQRGDRNSRVFTSTGLMIFDQVKQMKERGLSLPEIYKQLENTMEGMKTDTPANIVTDVETIKTHADEVIQLLKDHQRELKEEMEKRLRLQAEKDEEIRALTRENEAMAGAVKLLTDGRDPEVVKRERIEEQQRLSRMYDAMRTIEQEKEQARQEREEKQRRLLQAESQLQAEREQRQQYTLRIKELNKQISSLGLFSWKKRKALIAELNELLKQD